MFDRALAQSISIAGRNMRTESFLTKQQRASARKIAARNWNRINEQLPQFGETFRKNEARRLIRLDIEQEVKSKKRFGSIFTSILISLMLRLAMKWIEQWISQKLFSVSESGED